MSADLTARQRTLRYLVDEHSHIKVDFALCNDCEERYCALICPAACFTLKEEGGVAFTHVGCLECGACLAACGRGAIEWNYPRGGFGVSFRFS